MGKLTKAKDSDLKKEPASLFTKIGANKKNLICENIKSEVDKIKEKKSSSDRRSASNSTWAKPCDKFQHNEAYSSVSVLDISPNLKSKEIAKRETGPSCAIEKNGTKNNDITPTKVYKNSTKRLAKAGISPTAKKGIHSSFSETDANKDCKPLKRTPAPTSSSKDIVSCENDDILCEILNELHCEEPKNKQLVEKKTASKCTPKDENSLSRSKSTPVPRTYRESTVRPSDQFNRHIVINIQRNPTEVILDVKSENDDEIKQCILRGFWCDSHVSVGDIVNILVGYKDGVYTVDDKHGLLVINPDFLLSGTSIVSSVFCMRRSVLNEKFKGCDSKNVHMLYGSIIHCLFQKILKNMTYKQEEIMDAAQNVLKLNKFIHEMYSQDSDETVVLSEIEKYIPPLQSWVKKHTDADKTKYNSTEICINDVKDIEENIWSPRYGVKGKIDLTVQVKIPSGKNSYQTKTVPLELKTGRTTYSVEHKGQVTLYSMMSSDRRDDPEEGLLLYLKEPSMKMIPAKNENKKGLLQLRNEMAYYISHHVEKEVDEGHVTYNLGKLPEPINSQRSCSKCPQLLNCAIYQRSVEKYDHRESHAMYQLVPESLSHLTTEHLDYFIHWMLCMDLEKQAAQNTDIKQLWCSTSSERELSGDCIAGLVIYKTDVGQILASQNYSEGSDCLITFTRHHDYSPIMLNSVGMVKNDFVVISTEECQLLAISTGVIQNITDKYIYVAVDRDTLHTDKILQRKLFRLDKCNNFNTMGYLFTNLSRLMLDDPHSARLRDLIINKRKPEFNLTLSKKSIEKVKKHFKSMNKPQKTAILKVLMSKDYVLVKGFPGTGKTSTIVALVKILRSLGQTVLLTSYTHSAVDNILHKLKQDGLPFLRLGRLARIHPNIHDHSAEVLTSKITSVGELRRFYASQGIVATSCLGTNHPIFTQRRFDVCIIDEASQVLQPACLGPIFTSDKFILVGDSKQLSPVVQSREARDLGMEESLFIRLDGMGASYELNLQYRMNRVIMKLGNELVYGGALQCGSKIASEGCLVLSHPINMSGECDWLKQVLDCNINQSAVFCDTQQVPAPEVCDKKGVIENPVEAEIISTIILTLLKAGIEAVDIGVIAPYRSQVKLLHSQLKKIKVEEVEVNTVDQYQGRDKKVIIISFVRSYSERSKSSRGELLDDIKRLNVAVTRAKLKLIMVGDISTLNRYTPCSTIITSMKNTDQIIKLPKDAHVQHSADIEV
ncbi:DNA replication ATP-dependent helicase/nuclease DNA2 [Patella vulgata]|uniref:DNA replication ATP-dependent helicase/nuclease DNA2 n=1 Tax=Patella vulgata TaxID=6465 RepID=UPI0021804DB2|nr:DNA replication ATP-dependent helicase/nuclease DNA2 [Patella vulgata]